MKLYHVGQYIYAPMDNGIGIEHHHIVRDVAMVAPNALTAMRMFQQHTDDGDDYLDSNSWEPKIQDVTLVLDAVDANTPRIVERYTDVLAFHINECSEIDYVYKQHDFGRGSRWVNGPRSGGLKYLPLNGVRSIDASPTGRVEHHYLQGVTCYPTFADAASVLSRSMLSYATYSSGNRDYHIYEVMEGTDGSVASLYPHHRYTREMQREAWEIYRVYLFIPQQNEPSNSSGTVHIDKITF